MLLLGLPEVEPDKNLGRILSEQLGIGKRLA
jgi:hypothetical protein